MGGGEDSVREVSRGVAEGAEVRVGMNDTDTYWVGMKLNRQINRQQMKANN